MNYKYLLKIVVGAVLLLGGFFVCTNFSYAATTDNVHGWAWSDNIGWISFNCTDGGPAQSNVCGISNYGVHVASSTGTGIFSGYAWSDNIGWISFNPTDLLGCPSGSCQAEVDLVTGEVLGWAKALNSTGSDYGWISLRDIANGYNEVLINTTTGRFEDYGWGGGPNDEAVIGWVSFNCSDGGPSQSNICGTYDYYVEVDPSIFNGVPYVEDLSMAHSDFCSEPPSYLLGWTFRDDDAGAYETAYEVWIQNDSTLNSTTTLVSTYPPPLFYNGNTQEMPLSVRTSEDFNVFPLQITYGQSYSWSIRVQDNFPTWSVPIPGPGFTVEADYPDCSFDMDPLTPKISEEITFTDTSTAGTPAIPITDWSWDFGDGILSSTQHPTHTYYEVAPITVTLTITDSLLRSCTYERSFNVRPGRPEYIEVIPR